MPRFVLGMQLRSLLYRAFLLKWRHPFQTCLEVALLGLFAIIVSIVGKYLRGEPQRATNMTLVYNSTEQLEMLMNPEFAKESLSFAIAPIEYCEPFKRVIE